MTNRNQRGFTFVEIAIAVTILALMVYSIGLVATRGEGAYRSARRVADLEARMGRTMTRIVDELAGVGTSVPFPDPTGDFGTETLTFRIAAGVTDGDIDWGPLTRLDFAYVDDELDDGIDNNDNGLIDEGVLRLTRNVGLGNEQIVILCKDVSEFMPGEILNGDDDNGNEVTEERGFNVHQVGNILEIRLALSNLDTAGRLLERTISTSVRLRN